MQAQPQQTHDRHSQKLHRPDREGTQAQPLGGEQAVQLVPTRYPGEQLAQVRAGLEEGG